MGLPAQAAGREALEEPARGRHLGVELREKRFGDGHQKSRSEEPVLGVRYWVFGLTSPAPDP
jgi:hypothetical protein